MGAASPLIARDAGLKPFGRMGALVHLSCVLRRLCMKALLFFMQNAPHFHAKSLPFSSKLPGLTAKVSGASAETWVMLSLNIGNLASGLLFESQNESVYSVV